MSDGIFNAGEAGLAGTLDGDAGAFALAGEGVVGAGADVDAGAAAYAGVGDGEEGGAVDEDTDVGVYAGALQEALMDGAVLGRGRAVCGACGHRWRCGARRAAEGCACPCASARSCRNWAVSCRPSPWC